MRRLGTPADVGDVVSLFCSPQANWITGQVIFADGGASADELGSAARDPARLVGNKYPARIVGWPLIG